MSANCNRPPGRNTRITSLKTRRLSAQRLMTPLLMTASAQPFSTGSSSMIPFRNSTWPRPSAVAAARERSSISSVMSTPTTPLGADLSGAAEAVEPAARTEIDHPLPGMQCPLPERIAYTRKRLNGGLRHSGDGVLVVAQSSRQRSSGVEVEAAARIDGDLPILGPD